ncbi:hypothetical protein C8R45DRAFT_1098555 [Mycena sanguinolenta]|nr:hypothetical protein C8R45DRAFT_1098555 [Mycena sanguinolenta]
MALEIQEFADEIQRVIDENRDAPEHVDKIDPTRCETCLKSEMELPCEVTLKQCKDCGLAMYCSKECQRKAWPTHKAFCKQQGLSRLQIMISKDNKEQKDDSDNLNEPELERMLIYPEMEHLIENSSPGEPIPFRIVIRAEPFDPKEKFDVIVWEVSVDPDLGRWNPKCESNFIESIKLVQAGAPRLRIAPDQLDTSYKNKQPAPKA